jgi:spore maturation protein CgeB
MAKPKLLLAGFWSHAHCEESFSRQVDNYGMEVIPFKMSKYFDGKWGKYLNAIPLPIGPMLKINNDLLELIGSSNIDYIFLWNCNHILPSTLKKIKRSGIRIVVYNNDDPYGKVLKNRKPWLQFFQFFWFLKTLKFTDLIFVYRPINIEEASRLSNSSSQIKLFKPYFIPRVEDHSLVKINSEQDVVFIGHFEDDNRYDDLDYLFSNNINLKVYGTGWLKSFSQHQEPVYPLYGDDYVDALNNSKICLCFLSKMNRYLYTRRCFEIPGLKKLLLCERTDEMLNMFKEDEEAVYFSNKHELLNKIQWLLSNPSKIEDIAEAGYKRVLNDGHDIKSRSVEILKNLEF